MSSVSSKRKGTQPWSKHQCEGASHRQTDHYIPSSQRRNHQQLFHEAASTDFTAILNIWLSYLMHRYILLKDLKLTQHKDHWLWLKSRVCDVKHAVIDVGLAITPSMATWGFNTECEKTQNVLSGFVKFGLNCYFKSNAKQDSKPVVCRELFASPEMIWRGV